MNFARLRRRICGLALVLLAMAAASDGAQIIPVDRTFGAAWQNSGYPGAIPAPATIVNVRSFGATGDGVTDDRAATMRARRSWDASDTCLLIRWV